MTIPSYDSVAYDPQRDKRQLDVSFAGLQRMRIRKLQVELVNRVMSMHFMNEEPNDWENLMKEYSKWNPALIYLSESCTPASVNTQRGIDN